MKTMDRVAIIQEHKSLRQWLDFPFQEKIETINRLIKNIRSVLWFKKFKRNISFRLLYYSIIRYSTILLYYTIIRFHFFLHSLKAIV